MILTKSQMVANVGIKVLLSLIGAYFFITGNMFMAGLFFGWILTEVLVIISIIVTTATIVLKR